MSNLPVMLSQNHFDWFSYQYNIYNSSCYSNMTLYFHLILYAFFFLLYMFVQCIIILALFFVCVLYTFLLYTFYWINNPQVLWH